MVNGRLKFGQTEEINLKVHVQQQTEFGWLIEIFNYIQINKLNKIKTCREIYYNYKQ